jgi:hypothetical protein
MSSYARLTFAVLAALVLSICFSATHSALAQANGTSGIIISEFRFDGPNGTNDEFVEIVNNSATPKTIVSSDAGGTKGFSVWGIVGGQARKVCTIPINTLLLAGQHYLCAKVPGYELGGYSQGQNDNINNYTTTLSLGADGAVALFSSEDVVVNNDGTLTTPSGPVFREDAVGFRELNLAAASPLAAALREGPGLNPIGPQDPAGRAGAELREYSFVRKHVSSGNGTWSGATYQDTNNNLADFALVANIGDGPINRANVNSSSGQIFAATAFDPSPSGSPGSQTATTPVFGAPGPQSTTSPLERNYNTQFLRSLFDTGSAANVSPNIERNSQIVCGGSKGDLVLRFTYKNNTGVVQNNLRVRWIDMSTVNRNNASFTAVLNLLDSTAATKQVAVNNGSDTTNDPAPSGDGIVDGTAAGGDGVKVVRGTYVEGVDKTPPVLGYVVTSPSSGNFTSTTNQNFRQVNPTFTDTDGSPGSPCRVGGFNSANVAAPPTAGVTTTALPAPLGAGGSISLEHRFGVIKQGTFVVVGIIESN